MIERVGAGMGNIGINTGGRRVHAGNGETPSGRRFDAVVAEIQAAEAARIAEARQLLETTGVMVEGARAFDRQVSNDTAEQRAAVEARASDGRTSEQMVQFAQMAAMITGKSERGRFENPVFEIPEEMGRENSVELRSAVTEPPAVDLGLASAAYEKHMVNRGRG